MYCRGKHRAAYAVNVPVQPRVIHEELQAAADEQNQKHGIGEASESQPNREAVRFERRLGVVLGVER